MARYVTTGMLSISPIYLESATAAYADFFESTLHRERLGSLGHWQGRGVKLLDLKNPIELKAFENLLNGLTPNGARRLVVDAGDPKRIAAWRTTLVAPPLLNNLWAVAPREAHIRIERGFAQAVNRTMRCLDNVVTGVGTRAPKSDSQKSVLAVFRTQAAWDLSAELGATALLLNLGVQSPQKAQSFSPTQVMGSESGLQDFFKRVLAARLEEQFNQFKSLASRQLKLDEMVRAMSHKAALDAHSRSTWTRRDGRRIWNGGKNLRDPDWQRNARAFAQVARWTELTDYFGKPGEVFARLSKEFRNGRALNGHVVKQVTDSSEGHGEQTKENRQSAAETKSHKHFHGYSH